MKEPQHLAPGVVGPLSDEALVAAIWGPEHDAEFDAWAGIVPAPGPDAEPEWEPDLPLLTACALAAWVPVIAVWRWWLS